ncbi:MAG: aminotransferase class I/II-fold pyridoxal phosphate-dependent enzyme [Oscillospiraceae bacterium]|nr:aminotransferase class I/II-fold pyridoxal phosphate-dependent enzyme [Eubacteriales bacterium]MDY2617597.1 aminotransferase class I/II-fold pyridoxal phosphate-dependent enzyme [Oscillospiraceae bacterium]
MELHFAKRMESFQPGIFNVLNDKKNELLKAGRTVYNLSVGTPDFLPDENVMRAMQEACKDPDNYKYSLGNLPELVEAVQNWYQRRYGVALDPEEIMSVNGSQEGIAHVALPLCDPGDVVLCPNPGYPIFEMGPWLCGAEIAYYDLHEEDHYLPDLDAIPEDLAKRAKMMVVSYPLNPVCVAAPRSFYEKLIAFAKKYNIIILHDNAYSDIIYDGREGISFLSVPGAKEVGVEFNSLSKTYNLTGARISFVVGNREIIQAFSKVRSQIDYGIFLPIQRAAVEALNGPQDGVKARREEYQRRRDALCGGFRSIGWNVPDSEGTMFVWAPIPEHYSDSVTFCMDLMERSGLICTPGSAFGSLGEGHVRFALVQPVEKIREIVAAVDACGILKK